MICYKDRNYCNTNKNNCSNKACDRHLDTINEYYTLANNKHCLPICMADLSGDCPEFEVSDD